MSKPELGLGDLILDVARGVVPLLLLLLVMALLMSGCAAAGGYTQAAIDEAKRAADVAARVFVADTCAMTLGAYHRLPNPNQKLGANLICNPNAKGPITAEDVLRLMR